jgi:hypothetical protein
MASRRCFFLQLTKLKDKNACGDITDNIYTPEKADGPGHHGPGLRHTN